MRVLVITGSGHRNGTNSDLADCVNPEAMKTDYEEQAYRYGKSLTI